MQPHSTLSWCRLPRRHYRFPVLDAIRHPFGLGRYGQKSVDVYTEPENH